MIKVVVYTALGLMLQIYKYRCADKSLARPTSRCIVFDGENISFDVRLVHIYHIYIYIYIYLVLIVLRL